MSAVGILLILILLSFCSGGGGEKPGFNVILISLDTLRADHMGIYGYNRDTTPELDEFSKGALVFEKAYAQSPNTVISHATMLTALHPTVHETNADYILGDEFETLGEYFQKKGYKTGGFTTHGAWLNKQMGFSQGFDEFHAKFITAPMNNEYVFDFLDNKGDNRFFLFVHYYDIHSDYDALPYDTATDYDRKFCSDYDGNFTGCRDDVCGSTFLGKVSLEGWKISREDCDYITALYDGGIAYTDFHVGQLFKRLKKLGLFENSLIIITADHGEEFIEHGKMLHYQLYREIMHVPLIVKLPGKNNHSRITNPVGVIDIMPTILDLTGIKYKNLQGQSLLPIINGTEKKDRFVFSTLSGLQENGENVIFLRDGNTGLFAQDKFSKIEMYDIDTDPDETLNIAEKNEALKKKLTGEAITYYRDQWRIKKYFKQC